MRGVLVILLFFSSILSASPLKIVQIASGLYHHCARFSDGTLRCWGLNANGELGLEREDLWVTEAPDTPIVPLPLPVVDIALGGRHTCAIFSDKTVRCWGEALYGQLGVYSGETGKNKGDMKDLQPVLLPANFHPAKLYLSTQGSCVLGGLGAVYCWGNGTGEEILPPRKIDLPSPALSLALADETYCALFANGSTSCFRAKPMDSTGSKFDQWPGRKVRNLQAGQNMICAELEGLGIHCQGAETFAEKTFGEGLDLGTGLAVDQFKCASGGHHCCAVFAPSGTLKCFGVNSGGQLGQNDRLTRGDSPETLGEYLPFVDLGRKARVRLLSLGFSSTCVVVGDLNVHCWGYGRHGSRATDIEDSPEFHFREH